MAQQVYDGTVYFCSRFVDRRSRTHDQMVQAARKGNAYESLQDRYFVMLQSVSDLLGAHNATAP